MTSAQGLGQSARVFIWDTAEVSTRGGAVMTSARGIGHTGKVIIWDATDVRGKAARP